MTILASISSASKAQNATIDEELMEFKTYPFSDPNPVPDINRIYPYFYFHGYTNKPVTKKWKMVVLENDYIKVYVCPEIGGKVWGAIEKSTGKEFLYFNHVVKFRDVAMRGAWTSGGLEYNFGDIGHIPTCATPVDYVTRENADGSVSCIVGAIDLPSGTKWNVEIKVSPGKAFFETKTSWFNNTSLPCTYYHWMNAAAKASGNLEFFYPGNKYIGHGGEQGDWPNEKGRNLSFYENNNFGGYKSYHVINSYSDYFGGYWHDNDFGFGHLGAYDEKPGKKLWIWGLSQQGMIWEDLLTDNDGQYIEFQAGKLFNQAAHSSTSTPFKHKEFSPHDADIMHEIWFPLKGTGGMDAASEYGILSVTRDGNKLNMLINALQQLDDKLTIKQSGNIIKQVQVKLKPLESKTISISIPDKNFTIELVNNKLFYSSNSDDNIVERPTIPNSSFNWESAYGLYTMALELEKQRKYNEALRIYHKVILKDAGFKPALNRIASGYYRLMEYSKALKYVNLALSIDTYDAEANYIFGLINNKLGNPANAKSGFSIASSSVQYRVAGFTELAKIFIRERSYSKALHYTEKALAFNNSNPIAFHLQAIAYRKINRVPESKLSLEKLIALDATWHSTRFEFFMLDNSESTKSEFIKRITNELPAETFLDMAIEYHNLNLTKEAIMILGMAPEHPVVNLWLAYLDSDNTDKHLKKALAASPYLVFPFRNETAEILKQFNTKVNHWKLKYYLGLIYWNRGLESETRKLFNACGDTPDYAPFYLAQAKLNTDSQKRFDHLTIARDLAPDDWRTALALINYYLGNNRAEEAVGLSKEFTAKYPEQSAIGLSYARALMNKGDYQKAVNFLQKYDLLPFEGATAGRDIYHESCVRMAIKAISEKSYRSAIKWAAKAREWPVNLGVGRSYDVDERLEDFIVAYSLTKLGNQNRAATYYMNIVRYKCKDGTEEGAKLYLQLLALQKLGKEGQAKQLVAELTEQFPNNLYIKWAAGKIKSEEKSNELKQTIKNSNNEIQPYDTKFVDREFDLLMEFLEVL